MASAPLSNPKLTTLILLCGLSVLPLNILLPSLPTIGRDLHASYALVGLSLAGYAVGAASLEMVMGRLSDRFGRRAITLLCLTAFTAGSVGCALARTVWVFLTFRMIQAAITSVYPVSMAIIRDTASKKETASRIGYAATASAFAPMIGPALGGMLDGLCGWRWIFWALGLFGIALFTWCLVDLGETNTKHLSTMGKQAGAYRTLFCTRRFWAYALCMSFSTGTFYAFLAGAPLAAKVVFKVPTPLLGLYMGSITAGFMLGSFLSGRYARLYPLTTTMIAGRVVACAGPAIGLLLFLVRTRHPIALFGPCVLVGVGNGITNPCANAGALSVRPDLAGTASGLVGAMTIAGGAAFSSLTGLVLTEGDAIYLPLCMMLISSLLALVAAFCARLFDPPLQESAPMVL